MSSMRWPCDVGVHLLLTLSGVFLTGGALYFASDTLGGNLTSYRVWFDSLYTTIGIAALAWGLVRAHRTAPLPDRTGVHPPH